MSRERRLEPRKAPTCESKPWQKPDDMGSGHAYPKNFAEAINYLVAVTNFPGVFDK